MFGNLEIWTNGVVFIFIEHAYKSSFLYKFALENNVWKECNYASYHIHQSKD